MAHNGLLQIITKKGGPDRDSTSSTRPYVSLVSTSFPWKTLGLDMIGIPWPTPAPTLCLASPQSLHSLRANPGDQKGRHMYNPHRTTKLIPRRTTYRKSPKLRYPLLPHPPVTLPTPESYRRHMISPRCGRRYRRPPTQHSRKQTLPWSPLGVDIGRSLQPTLLLVRKRL